MAESHGDRPSIWREESDKEPRDTLETAVWLNSRHRARVPGLRTRFSFNNAWKSHKNAVDSQEIKRSLGIEYIINI